MADTKRRKTVSVSFADNGDMLLALYTAPDMNGQQGVAETITVPPSLIHDSLVEPFALRGVADALRNQINRLENPSASQARAEYDRFMATITDGTWTPGRTFGEAEPDDLMLALAEVTGQPVHVIQNKLSDMLDEIAKNADGTDKRTANGRVVHVHSKSKLYAALEASDPRVKLALSRITAERAKRMAADAKTAKSTGLLDMFGPAVAAAAN